jgi:hypothetical protein
VIFFSTEKNITLNEVKGLFCHPEHREGSFQKEIVTLNPSLGHFFLVFLRILVYYSDLTVGLDDAVRS